MGNGASKASSAVPNSLSSSVPWYQNRYDGILDALRTCPSLITLPATLLPFIASYASSPQYVILIGGDKTRRQVRALDIDIILSPSLPLSAAPSQTPSAAMSNKKLTDIKPSMSTSSVVTKWLQLPQLPYEGCNGYSPAAAMGDMIVVHRQEQQGHSFLVPRPLHMLCILPLYDGYW
jgi:hypothetical protein